MQPHGPALRPTGALLASLLLAGALAACSSAGGSPAPTGGTPTGAPTAAPATEPPPSATAFQILTPAQAPQACMDALMIGKLVRHPATGLGVQGDNAAPSAVEWPFGYSARVNGLLIELVDENGQPVAREGDQISMGGGFGNQLWHACGPVTLAPPA